MSPDHDTVSHMNGDELMMGNDSKTAFALYRPEIRKITGPLTYKQAVKKYRQNAEPHLGEHQK